ncbi:MAG: serine hydrolase [Phycisphaerae bacterium]|nr:serine hydrolase [Phycisphaerae bacterium]
MRHVIYVVFGLLAFTVVPTAAADRDAPREYDLLIRGGTVIDGTGTPGRTVDVLIADGRVAFIGDQAPVDVQIGQTINATGKVVTPGFIDAHCHGDPITRPGLDSFLAMGVTTICIGQDGESPEDLAGWMQQVGNLHPGANVATFVGHGTVRNLAGVGLKPKATPEQLELMQKLVAQAMALGCFGLTSGLEYQPGSFADLDELIAIAKPVGQAGGLIMSHMRSEDDDRHEEALAELIAQGRGGNCAVQVSHIKVTYGHGAERAERVLNQMRDARDSGVPVTADIYPYTASYTGIGIVFPDWAKPPHDYDEIVRTRRADLAAYLRERVTLRNGPEATLFGTGKWAGKTLAQVADEAGKPFEDVLIDDIGRDGASAAYFVMDEGLQARLMADPHVMFCSDGSATSSHPRGHGTFARIIRKFVVEDKLLSLEEAVRKMTGLTAETVGLDELKRGRLAEGWAADVLVFDPAQVRDNATFESPHELATGFDWVIVNGQVAYADGKATDAHAGRMLRRLDPGLAQRVRELCAEFDKPDTPGISVAIYRDGETVLAQSSGLANIEQHIAADEHTNYRIASMTKAFTALCIMMLQERGQLSYDDPITRFFPDFPAIGKEITVRDLLGHTSGLIDYEDIIPDGRTEQLKDRDVLALLMRQRGTYFTPGTQYRYSNTGYAVLALIVEQASGTDFATFLRENIFQPLGMSETVAYEKGVSEMVNRAFGCRQTDAGGWEDADQSLTSAVLGDGGVYTSLADYARWAAALDAGRLVTPETFAEAFKSGVTSDGKPTGYGFGWRIDRCKGWTVIHHDGGTCGFNSAVRRVPQQKLTLVVLSNRAGRAARDIADTLLDSMLVEVAPVVEQTETSAMGDWQWHDARDLRVEGRGWTETQLPYERLPRAAQDVVPPAVWRLSKNTAGICVRFVTNSPRIAATWDGGGAMVHMAATGNSGLDLYERQDGQWVFRGVGKPKTATTTAPLAYNLPDQPTEYLLYLPLYNDVTELRIGVKPGAEISSAPERDTRPIVFYGTSITQGGCAARAGMCHPAILGRHLNREIINLGFSGSGKMEPEMAELLCELDPELYVLECLPNMTLQMVRERVMPFVHRLREVHPDTPILLAENPHDAGRNPGNQVLRRHYDELTAAGVSNLHYLSGEEQLAGVENGTVDGVHPTDLGFDRMARVYEPVLREILNAD